MPFSNPSVAPVSEEKHNAYNELENMLSDGTLLSGWAVA